MPGRRRSRRNKHTHPDILQSVASDIHDANDDTKELTKNDEIQNPSPGCTTTGSISSDLSVPVGDNQSKTESEPLLLRIKHYLENSADGGMFTALMDKLVTFLEARESERGWMADVLSDLFDNLQNDTKNVRTFFKSKLQELQSELNLKKIEIDASRVTRCSSTLGKGQFGVITLGYLKTENNSSREKVALKTFHPYRMECPENEAEVMAEFDHPNIVKLFGILTKPEYTLIMEYCELKDLSTAIRQRSIRTDEELLKCLVDISAGMVYIVKKKCFHRDLALRNVFVTSAKVCKVGDFGLSRKTGDTDGETEFELSGVDELVAPPEVSMLRDWTWRSDVWSMGILIWSMYYIASNEEHDPFLFYMSMRSQHILRLHTSRFQKPSRCPTELHNYVNMRLLDSNPEQRPSFKMIKELCVRHLRSPNS